MGKNIKKSNKAKQPSLQEQIDDIMGHLKAIWEVVQFHHGILSHAARDAQMLLEEEKAKNEKLKEAGILPKEKKDGEDT